MNPENRIAGLELRTEASVETLCLRSASGLAWPTLGDLAFVASFAGFLPDFENGE